MSDDPIQYEMTDGVAVITLNRPDKLNAITPDMGAAYSQALYRAAEDASVRCAVVTGAGRGFCAGADLTLLAQGPEALDAFIEQQGWGNFPTTAMAIPIPVVMAVNGPAAGVGMVLALTADVRFASPSASFLSAFSRLGLVAEYGCAWLLSRHVGLSRATEILLSGRKVEADEAARIGLVNDVVDDPRAAAIAWAREVARHCSPSSLAIMKGQLLQHQDYPASLHDSLLLMQKSFRGPDLPEALIARTEGRPPAFRRDPRSGPTAP